MRSAHSEVITDSPELPPQPDAPAELPYGSQQSVRRPVRKLLVICAIPLSITVAGLFFLRSRTRSFSTNLRPSTISENANVDSTLRLMGTTEAVQARGILAPRLAGEQVGALTITKLVSAGTHVKRGDLLVEFDRQAQIKNFLDQQAEYNKLLAQVTEEQAKESAARAKDETELKQADNDLKKAELEMQKVEILSRIDAEKNQENLEEAKATVQQLRETFDLKRRAAQAAIRILEIQRDRTRQTMLHAQANAELMQIRSPIDGVVVFSTIWKEGRMGEVQEGDQVRPGVAFMQVVNPSLMQVRVLVNQEDFLRMHISQNAQVRLDAYPELVFPGKLEQMAPIARNGDFSAKVRTFAVVFSIEGNDPKLMPDLSAAVDVQLGQASTFSSGSQ